MRSSVVSRVWVLLGLLLLPVVACDDGSSPATEFDAESTAEVMAELASVSAELEPALASLEAASEVLPGESMAGLVWDGAAPQPSVSALRAVAELRAEASFPAEVLGVTFVWDVAEGRYVASELEGAPADGLRVIYYAVDPVTREPASPLNELGHVDLRDLSTEASNRLAVEVVSTASPTPVALASYYVDVSFTITQSSLDVASEAVGYLSDGTERLDFDLSQDVALSETELVVTQAFAMALEGRDQGVSWQSTLSGDPANETAELSVLATVTNGAEEVVLDLTGAGDVLDGEIRYQGATVAYIGGTFAEPEFTDPNGDPLSSAQWSALTEVWQAFEGLFELAEGLLTPAG
jgi:hypothetical protein